MKKIKHTKTPWTLDKTGVVGVKTIILANDGNDRVATIDGTSSVDMENESNAIFIVHAVNNHIKLLQAVEEGIRQLKAYGADPEDYELLSESVRRLRG